MSLNVKKILRQIEMSLEQALKDGHAVLTAGSADGAVKTSRGFVRSDMLSQGWKFTETSGGTEVFSKNIEVVCIFSKEHDSFGPPVVDDEIEASDAIDALNTALVDAGVSPAKLLRDFNNGSYLAAGAKAKPKKAGSTEDLQAAFAAKAATDPKLMSEFLVAMGNKTTKEFLKKWFATQA